MIELGRAGRNSPVTRRAAGRSADPSLISSSGLKALGASTECAQRSSDRTGRGPEAPGGHQRYVRRLMASRLAPMMPEMMIAMTARADQPRSEVSRGLYHVHDKSGRLAQRQVPGAAHAGNHCFAPLAKSSRVWPLAINASKSQ